MSIGVLVAIMIGARNNESYSYSAPSYKSSVISCAIMLMINIFLVYLVTNNLLFKNELLNNILLYVLVIDALVSFITLPYFIIKMIIE